MVELYPSSTPSKKWVKLSSYICLFVELYILIQLPYRTQNQKQTASPCFFSYHCPREHQLKPAISNLEPLCIRLDCLIFILWSAASVELWPALLNYLALSAIFFPMSHLRRNPASSNDSVKVYIIKFRLCNEFYCLHHATLLYFFTIFDMLLQWCFVSWVYTSRLYSAELALFYSPPRIFVSPLFAPFRASTTASVNLFESTILGLNSSDTLKKVYSMKFLGWWRYERNSVESWISPLTKLALGLVLKTYCWDSLKLPWGSASPKWSYYRGAAKTGFFLS